MARPSQRPPRGPAPRRAWLLLPPVLLLPLAVLWPRGRGPDLRPLLRQVRPLSAERVEPGADRQGVAVTGTLRAAAPLSDPGWILPGDYIQIHRQVEMYAWHEVKKADLGNRRRAAGAERSASGYELRFGSEPPATGEMDPAPPGGNPPMPLRGNVISAQEAFVGAYRFSPRAARLLGDEALWVRQEMLERDDRRQRILQGAIYLKGGLNCGPGSEPESDKAPCLGDLRISYRVVRAGAVVTLLGEQRGQEIVPFRGALGARLFHLVPGTAQEAIDSMRRSEVPFIIINNALGEPAGPARDLMR